MNARISTRIHVTGLDALTHPAVLKLTAMAEKQNIEFVEDPAFAHIIFTTKEKFLSGKSEDIGKESKWYAIFSTEFYTETEERCMSLPHKPLDCLMVGRLNTEIDLLCYIQLVRERIAVLQKNLEPFIGSCAT